jgi:hypothetical protein
MRRKILKLAILALALSVITAGCGTKKGDEAGASTNASSTEAETEEFVGMANPWVDYSGIDEAEKAVGFDFVLPDAMGESKEGAYRCMQDTMIEVIYLDSKGEEAYRLRKGRGSEDISGDYNSYSNITEYTVDTNNGQVMAILSGNGDKISLITFCVGDDFTYAMTADNFKPGVEEAKKLVDQILERNQ